jgi:hypothetical protein
MLGDGQSPERQSALRTAQPLTPKLHDRAALPDPFAAAGRVAPLCAEAATDTERLLVEIWTLLVES